MSDQPFVVYGKEYPFTTRNGLPEDDLLTMFYAEIRPMGGMAELYEKLAAALAVNQLPIDEAFGIRVGGYYFPATTDRPLRKGTEFGEPITRHDEDYGWSGHYEFRVETLRELAQHPFVQKILPEGVSRPYVAIRFPTWNGHRFYIEILPSGARGPMLDPIFSRTGVHLIGWAAFPFDLRDINNLEECMHAQKWYHFWKSFAREHLPGVCCGGMGRFDYDTQSIGVSPAFQFGTNAPCWGTIAYETGMPPTDFTALHFERDYFGESLLSEYFLQHLPPAIPGGVTIESDPSWVPFMLSQRDRDGRPLLRPI